MQMPPRLPSLDLLRGFEAAARHLSFTKAARELHVTQSAVSRQVKTIEDQLGVRLFRRMNRALLLTEEGQALARAVGAALAGIENAVARLPALAEDHPITVTTSVGFAALWLVPRLARLRATHPDIDVRLAASNEIADLQRERMDVAIRFCEPQAAPRGAVPLIGEDVFLSRARASCATARTRSGRRPISGTTCCCTSTTRSASGRGSPGRNGWSR
jgi:DNA-binding transcriptional LysR family regulator